jgi:hypothetical protein
MFGRARKATFRLSRAARELPAMKYAHPLLNASSDRLSGDGAASAALAYFSPAS